MVTLLASYEVGNGQLPDRRKATMPTVVYIGDKLKEVRTRRLLTQIELAEKASVNHSTIVNIERNQVEPHFRTIRKLAKALDIDPTVLLGD
jgi:transcriptional regulator with XRE-family HTH domain